MCHRWVPKDFRRKIRLNTNDLCFSEVFAFTDKMLRNFQRTYWVNGFVGNLWEDTEIKYNAFLSSCRCAFPTTSVLRNGGGLSPIFLVVILMDRCNNGGMLIFGHTSVGFVVCWWTHNFTSIHRWVSECLQNAATSVQDFLSLCSCSFFMLEWAPADNNSSL